MDLDKIKQLIDAMAASDLTELELVEATWTLRLSRAPKPAAAVDAKSPPVIQAKSFVSVRPAVAAAPASATLDVAAPLSGVVYLQPAPDKPPFVSIGQSIKAGTPVCVIEAMKVFNEVRAEADGVVDAIMVTSGGEIDAGQPVLRLLRQAA